MARALAGEEAAWEALVERYADVVFAVARRTGLADAAAGDVVEDVFLALLRHLGRLRRVEVLTAWIAFTAATPENGCMRYSRGGHRARLRHLENKTDDNMLTRGQEIAVEIDPATVVDVRLSPGQASLHDALTPHASGPNTTDATRIGFAIRYAPTRVRQTSGPPITARLVRGTDRLGHFELEGGPYPALSPDALAAHLRALAPHAATAYSTI